MNAHPPVPAHMHVHEAIAVGPINGGGAARQRRGQRVVAHKPERTEGRGRGGEEGRGVWACLCSWRMCFGCVVRVLFVCAWVLFEDYMCVHV